MNTLALTFANTQLLALPSGALYWPDEALLCVSDLHLGKSERMARRGGALLPPYEGRETLDKLARDIAATTPSTVVCLGDSFDDARAADALEPALLDALGVLMAGRDWIWIEGNHEAGPVAIPGRHLLAFRRAGLVFRHIAEDKENGEISGHYHPKARVETRAGAISRRCFLKDARRLIMPAYGAFTGSLDCCDTALAELMEPDALAVLLSDPPLAMPMPRAAAKRDGTRRMRRLGA
ncbi:MAG: ligase-associated DNA damage response endonuclease PdeM [Pseudomonadota bacterium]